MAEYMAPSVLTDKVPQVCAQAHIRDGRLLQIPVLHRQITEEEEAFPVDEILAQVCHAGRQTGEGKLVLQGT